MTIFETLPNEILIEIFEYFNGFDIFLSFNQLNSRLNHLIRTIPIHLNFQHIHKTLFDQFCLLIQSNSSIKQQISSLILSNKDTCGQIDLFLSNFSLKDFPILRSLTFIQIEQQNINQIKSILPFLVNLQTFRLLDLYDLTNEHNEIISLLPLSNLRYLSISSLTFIKSQSNLTYLTVSGCTLDQLFYQFFEHIPLLKYLKIENIYKASHSIKNHHCSIYHRAFHLKQMIINNYEYLFDEFEIFVQLLPNLQQLTISALDNLCMIDAQRWEVLIKSSLKILRTFQFIFGLYCRGQVRRNVIEKFQQFQTNFWSKEHSWNIEYVLDTNAAVIYTIPYISNAYRLTRSTEKFPIKSFENFNNVTDLTLSCEATINNCLYYFTNIRSLTLESIVINSKSNEKYQLDFKQIKSLQITVNFYNLTHLDISFYSTIESAILLEIFTNVSHLSSLTIDPFVLFKLIHDKTLHQYFQKMIRRLNIYKLNHHSFENCQNIEQFCEIFPLLEQLTCSINHIDQFSMLLKRLTNLSKMKIFIIPSDTSEQILIWFKNEAKQLNIIYRIRLIHFEVFTENSPDLSSIELFIWLG